MKYKLLLLSILFFLSGCASEKENLTGNVVVMEPKLKETKDVNKEFTIEEVASHNSKEDCYTIIDSKVYDLTEWISKHPGGENAILKLCGIDGTSIFRAQHGNNPKQENILDGFLVGNLI